MTALLTFSCPESAPAGKVCPQCEGSARLGSGPCLFCDGTGEAEVMVQEILETAVRDARWSVVAGEHAAAVFRLLRAQRKVCELLGLHAETEALADLVYLKVDDVTGPVGEPWVLADERVAS